MIYLDNNATSPIDPKVTEAVLPYLSEHWGNPSSSYQLAKTTSKAIAKARQQVAEMITADPNEIIFTGCGTESNHAALNSAIKLYPERPHLITAATEHSAILEHAEIFEEGDIAVTTLSVDTEGLISLQDLEAALEKNGEGKTALVSLMWANNETGVINSVEEAAQLAHQYGALFHTDAVQAGGKLNIDLKKTEIDYLSLSGHKFHAPKGVGVLYASNRVRFTPYLIGGGQEGGRRAGTENIAGIVGLGKAAELMSAQEEEPIKKLRDHFESELLTQIEGASVNGSLEKRLPTTSNIYFPHIEAAGLLILLDKAGIYASAGSACHTASLHPSHVLKAMGYDCDHAACSMRFSLSRFTTEQDIETALSETVSAIKKMQSLRPPPSKGPVRRS